MYVEGMQYVDGQSEQMDVDNGMWHVYIAPPSFVCYIHIQRETDILRYGGFSHVQVSMICSNNVSISAESRRSQRL